MGARWGREVTTLEHAWREFRVKRSPRIIGAAIVLALGARLALGGIGWADLAAAAAMTAVYPFGEWAIHVYLLHMPPFSLLGRRVHLITARAHAEHHQEPNRLGLILLGPLEALALLGLAVPAAVALLSLAAAVLPGPLPRGAPVTALMTGYVLVGVYEWTHFLIHTAHRPRTRLYRSAWRAHRLHHFKNERYWHGVTSTVADRALGTHPDHRDVPRSRRARTLDANA